MKDKKITPIKELFFYLSMVSPTGIEPVSSP